MASVSSLGIGTGVDLQSMLSKIMDAESAPLTTLDKKITSLNTQISLYGTIKSKLSSLQTAAETLAFPSRLGAVTATPGDSSVLSSTASATAAQGTYSINVDHLASAQKTFTQTYEANTVFSAGSLTFTFSGDPTPHNIAIADGDTLGQISAKINSADIGVKAVVISGVDGNRLMLSGTSSGAANAFTFASTVPAPDSVATPGTPQSLLQNTDNALKVTAKDALMMIDGVPVASSTNTFATQVSGLTLTVLKPGVSSVTVQTDNTKVVSAMQAFVNAYNAVVTEVKNDTAYNSTTKSAQPLTGDTAARSILTTLTATRSATPSSLASSTVQTLSALGVTIQQNGQLSLDSTKLTKTLNTSPSDAMKAVNAFGKAFGDVATSLQASGGNIENRISNLNTMVKRNQDSQTALQARLSIIQAQYQKQFSALDSLVNRYKTTSGYLTQQFSALSGSKG